LIRKKYECIEKLENMYKIVKDKNVDEILPIKFIFYMVRFGNASIISKLWEQETCDVLIFEDLESLQNPIQLQGENCKLNWVW